jgi:hypothetical protein
MPSLKIHRDEMKIVKEAAMRVERRSNSRFVMDQTKIEVTDDPGQQPIEKEEEAQPPVVCE